MPQDSTLFLFTVWLVGVVTLVLFWQRTGIHEALGEGGTTLAGFAYFGALHWIGSLAERRFR